MATSLTDAEITSLRNLLAAMESSENVNTVLDLENAGTLNDSDVLYIIQGSNGRRDRKTTLGLIKSYLHSIVMAAVLYVNNHQPGDNQGLTTKIDDEHLLVTDTHNSNVADFEEDKITFGVHVYAESNLDLSGDLTVAGAAGISGGLSVYNGMSVNGVASFSNGLTSNGAIVGYNGLSITGESTFNGSVGVKGGLTVGNGITCPKDLNVGQSLLVNAIVPQFMIAVGNDTTIDLTQTSFAGHVFVIGEIVFVRNDKTDTNAVVKVSSNAKVEIPPRTGCIFYLQRIAGLGQTAFPLNGIERSTL